MFHRSTDYRENQHTRQRTYLWTHQNDHIGLLHRMMPFWLLCWRSNPPFISAMWEVNPTIYICYVGGQTHQLYLLCWRSNPPVISAMWEVKPTSYICYVGGQTHQLYLLCGRSTHQLYLLNGRSNPPFLPTRCGIKLTTCIILWSSWSTHHLYL